MDDSAAATQADAVAVLLRCLTTASNDPKGDQSTVSKSLQVLKCLLTVDSSKAAFARGDGARQLADLLSQQSGKQGAPCIADFATGLSSALSAVTSTCSAKTTIAIQDGCGTSS